MMTVLVYPIDHWFSHLLIDALLIEGYEVRGLSEFYDQTSDEPNDRMESVHLQFGRNANFALLDEFPTQKFSHALFIEKQIDIERANGIFVTSQPKEDSQTNVKTISVQFDKEDGREFNAKEDLPLAKKYAQWIARHGLSDFYPDYICLYETESENSIYMI